MINSPCNKCTLRNETCHSNCKMYKLYKADLEIYNAKKKEDDYKYADYKVSYNRCMVLREKSDRRKIHKN